MLEIAVKTDRSFRRSLGDLRCHGRPRGKSKVNNVGWKIHQFRMGCILRPCREDTRAPGAALPAKARSWRGRAWLSVILLSSVAWASAGSGTKAAQETGEVRVDYKSARRDIQNVEMA